MLKKTMIISISLLFLLCFIFLSCSNVLNNMFFEETDNSLSNYFTECSYKFYSLNSDYFCCIIEKKDSSKTASYVLETVYIDGNGKSTVKKSEEIDLSEDNKVIMFKTTSSIYTGYRLFNTFTQEYSSIFFPEDMSPLVTNISKKFDSTTGKTTLSWESANLTSLSARLLISTSSYTYSSSSISCLRVEDSPYYYPEYSGDSVSLKPECREVVKDYSVTGTYYLWINLSEEVKTENDNQFKYKYNLGKFEEN